MKTSYHHPELGELTINRSPRSRRLSVSVRPSGVTLTLPSRFPLAEALAFAESKREWIELAKARAAKRIKPPRIVLPPFHTRRHELVVHRGELPGGRIQDGQILITLPPHWELTGEPAQTLIKKGITETYRREAKALLPERIARLAAKYGFSYTALSFRNAVSRWGSCSGKNAISLNIQLMALPDDLIDYVLLHELCHTRQKNHGPLFHRLLNTVTEGAHKDLNRRLKNYTPRW